MTRADPAPLLLAHHLGQLHSYETLIVLVVAFGPFVVIMLLALRERRRAAEAGASGSDPGAGSPDDPARRPFS